MTRALPTSLQLEREQAILSQGCSADQFSFLRLGPLGGMSCILFAKCTAPGFPFPDKEFALKMITWPRSDTEPSHVTRRRYQREFRLQRVLKHKNILPLRGYFTDPPPPIVLDWLAPDVRYGFTQKADGTPREPPSTTFGIFDAHAQSLKAFLESQPRVLPFHVFYKLCDQVLCAAEYLHTENIVHNDVKTANALVTPDLTLLLCDFGEALEFVSGMFGLGYHTLQGVHPQWLSIV